MNVTGSVAMAGVGTVESVTRRVTGYVPATVGVPKRDPAGVKYIPVGSDPFDTDQVTDPVAPVADRYVPEGCPRVNAVGLGE